ncbi:hypothetical protein SDC9_37572 [bioreactor metagenome]|jgi:hypothetical protein|uniref:Uncharacterized protein n=1 Tax=bioreactor metagenome TaxID=1076179 RepID=A0A644VJL1_9ZZZZ
MNYLKPKEEKEDLDILEENKSKLNTNKKTLQ